MNRRKAIAAIAQVLMPVLVATIWPACIAPAAQPLQPNRFLQEWLIAGPFDLPAFSPISPLDIPYILDEDLIAPRAGDEVLYRGRSLVWQPVASPIIDFDSIFSPVIIRPPGCVYVFARIDCPAPGDYAFIPVVSDGLKMWVNGDLILTMNAATDWTKRQDNPIVRLKAGSNHIMAKITSYFGYWGFGLYLEPVHGWRVRIGDRNARSLLSTEVMPEATLEIFDAASTASITTPLAGFGGMYSAAVTLPNAAFTPADALLSIPSLTGSTAFQERLRRLDPPLPGGINYEAHIPQTSRLTGRVINDETDLPVGGAHILFGAGIHEQFETSTDGAGFFEFPIPYPGKSFLRVTAPRHHPWMGTFPINDGFLIVTQIRLLPANHQLRGVIRDGWTNRPLPNALIEYDIGGLQSLATRTDNAGRYEIALNTNRLGRFVANVILDDFYFSEFGLPFRIAPQDLIHDVELRPVSVDVTTQLPGGEAWPDATVTLFHYLFPDGGMTRTAVTDAQGRARLEFLPEGVYMLAVHDALRGAATRRVDLTGPRAEFHLRLPDYPSRPLDATDIQGAPLPDAVVELRLFAPTCPIMIASQTNAAGRATLPPVQAELVEVAITHPAHPTLRFRAAPEQLPATVRVPWPHRVTIEARAWEGGGLIADANMTLRHAGSDLAGDLDIEILRAADGQFTLLARQAPLDLAGYSLLVMAPGFESRLFALDALAPQAAQNQPLTFTLNPETLRPVWFVSTAGAEISHVSTAWFRPEFPFRSGSGNYHPEPLLRDSGPRTAASIAWPPAVEPDQWQILAWKPNYGFALCPPGETWSGAVRLRQFARLTGRLGLSGFSRQEAFVQVHTAGALRESGLHLTFQSRLRQGGWFEFTDLIPGDWRVDFYSRFHESDPGIEQQPFYSAQIAVQPLVSTFVDIPGPDAAVFTGAVTNASGEQQMAAIFLKPMGDNKPGLEPAVIAAMHLTNREGRFYIEGLPPGLWRVTIHPRYANEGRPHYTDRTRQLTDTIQLDRNTTLERSFQFLDQAP